MEAFLAKELFSFIGVKFTGRTILYIVLTIAIIVAGVLAYKKIREPYVQLASAQSQIASLSKDNEKLKSQKADLEKTNHDNSVIYQAAIDQLKSSQQIAQDEKTASTARDAKSKDIRNAISNAKSDGQPVSPVILSTADSLWGPEAAGNK